jgi:hypothetical protein
MAKPRKLRIGTKVFWFIGGDINEQEPIVAWITRLGQKGVISASGFQCNNGMVKTFNSIRHVDDEFLARNPEEKIRHGAYITEAEWDKLAEEREIRAQMLADKRNEERLERLRALEHVTK